MAKIDEYAVHSGRVYGEGSKVYNIVGLLKSSGGGASMEFLFGTAAPAAGDGKSGDIYLNTGNGDLYKKTDAWAKIGNLKGPAGAKGDTGAKGDPGAAGAKGDKGDTGAKGADGAPTQAEWNALVARVEALEG